MRFHGTMRINGVGHLEIGGCDTVKLAGKYGTPLWIMDEEYIREKCRRFRKAFMEGGRRGDVAYASKAFLTLAMAAIINEEGLSLDVVSQGELYIALKAGFPPERIYFHGNNKSLDELKMAVKVGVGRIVVDNFYEIDLLEKAAGDRKVNIMLRVTPGVEALTHDYIKTGQEDSKFGFSIADGDALTAVNKVHGMKNIVLKGIHCHIGSQIFETRPFVEAADILLGFIRNIKHDFEIDMEELNLGGGFGIYYSPGDEPRDIASYADHIFHLVEDRAREYDLKMPKIIVEPGRIIAGPAGTTLYTVGSIKNIPGIRKYVSVDGGMTDNIRPALYQARYEAIIANRAGEEAVEPVTIAGKCCESGDLLIKDICLPEIESGDILGVSCTGAYGYSMASNYNKLPRPAVVLVREGTAELIVKRETPEDLIANEILPKRLAKDVDLPYASMS